MVLFNDRAADPSPAFQSTDEIKAAHKGPWFSKDSMRFFDSRVGKNVYGGTHFVTSEKLPGGGGGGGGERRYSVRSADPSSGDISTVGEFMEHGSRREAVKAAQSAVAEKMDTEPLHPQDRYTR